MRRTHWSAPASTTEAAIQRDILRYLTLRGIFAWPRSRAVLLAADRRHEYATLEHLLLALIAGVVGGDIAIRRSRKKEAV